MTVGRWRIELGRDLNVLSMASKPSKVRGWFYTFTISICRSSFLMTHADMSREVLVMGWMSTEWLELMYRQDRGRVSSEFVGGRLTTRCQPDCSGGPCVYELIGGSCKARNRKLAIFSSLMSKLRIEGERLQFSCRIATVSGILRASMV